MAALRQIAAHVLGPGAARVFPGVMYALQVGGGVGASRVGEADVRSARTTRTTWDGQRQANASSADVLLSCISGTVAGGSSASERPPGTGAAAQGVVPAPELLAADGERTAPQPVPTHAAAQPQDQCEHSTAAAVLPHAAEAPQTDADGEACASRSSPDTEQIMSGSAPSNALGGQSNCQSSQLLKKLMHAWGMRRKGAGDG